MRVNTINTAMLNTTARSAANRCSSSSGCSTSYAVVTRACSLGQQWVGAVSAAHAPSMPSPAARGSHAFMTLPSRRHTAGKRTGTVARTSADWWEDEEEFGEPH